MKKTLLSALGAVSMLSGVSCGEAATPTPGFTDSTLDTFEISVAPNILFVVSDDLNTDVGPYVESSLELHTPNLDRIAAAGVTFTRAYAQYPVCGPSRASFMSGLYPETNGVTGNGFETANHRFATPALADHPALGGFLRGHGYYTARVSKIFHMGVPGGIERGEVGSDDPDSWDYALNVMAPETLSPGFLEKLSVGDHYGSNFSRMILADGAEVSQADVLATDQAIAILANRARPKPPNATNRTKLKEEAPGSRGRRNSTVFEGVFAPPDSIGRKISEGDGIQTEGVLDLSQPRGSQKRPKVVEPERWTA